MGGQGRRERRAAASISADGWTCHYCRALDIPRDKLTVDHIIPKALGGPNAKWNRVLCCQRCNVRKSDQTYEEFTGKDQLPVQCWRHARTTAEFLLFADLHRLD
jgi:5-methylcytosine-specific restriction endonuclease McrA